MTIEKKKKKMSVIVWVIVDVEGIDVVNEPLKVITGERLFYSSASFLSRN